MDATERTRTSQEFMSPDGLAEFVDVPVSTVYRWNYEGTGPPRCRVGKHVRYRVVDVEAWIAERTERGVVGMSSSKAVGARKAPTESHHIKGALANARPEGADR